MVYRLRIGNRIFHSLLYQDIGAAAIPPHDVAALSGGLQTVLRGSKTAVLLVEPLGAGIHGRRGVNADEPWDARIGNDSDAYGPAGSYSNEAHDGARDGPGRPGLSTVPRDDVWKDRDWNRYNGQSTGLVSEDTESNELRDPFGDDAEHSDRDPNPQPTADMTRETQEVKKHGDDSLTERRSIFRESL
ncbi:hypothetical protein VTN77DRAFT_5673 [Rasamsonia byssochlamydoides]|uniref:uncharacterized protein n=1 Tax=Rasamsonia byssochlamydoides TaxID=89139 RepID=UPI003742927E